MDQKIGQSITRVDITLLAGFLFHGLLNIFFSVFYGGGIKQPGWVFNGWESNKTREKLFARRQGAF